MQRRGRRLGGRSGTHRERWYRCGDDVYVRKRVDLECASRFYARLMRHAEYDNLRGTLELPLSLAECALQMGNTERFIVLYR